MRYYDVDTLKKLYHAGIGFGVVIESVDDSVVVMSHDEKLHKFDVKIFHGKVFVNDRVMFARDFIYQKMVGVILPPL